MGPWGSSANKVTSQALVSSTALCIFTDVWGGSGGTGRAEGGPRGLSKPSLPRERGGSPQEQPRLQVPLGMSGFWQDLCFPGSGPGSGSSFLLYHPRCLAPSAPHGPLDGDLSPLWEPGVGAENQTLGTRLGGPTQEGLSAGWCAGRGTPGQPEPPIQWSPWL